MLTDFILAALIAVLVALSIRYLLKGGGSCSGSCSSCKSGCSSAQADKKTIEETRMKMKMLSSDVIAVCCRDMMCVPFEQADYFLMGFVKNGALTDTMISSSGLGGTSEKLDLLKKCRVKTIVCTGTGAGALHKIEKAGIACKTVAPVRRDDALQAGLTV